MEADNERLRKEVAELQKQLHLAERKAANGNVGKTLEKREASSDAESLDEEEIEAIWDEDDQVWRCDQCLWEIDEDACIGCGMKYEVPESNELSCSTVSQAETLDRCYRERGSTPEFDVGQVRIPEKWKNQGREDEHCELIQRGATPLMCEVFKLRFTQQGGIFAYADEDLWDEFAGVGMIGHTWKISLGRRLELDVEDHDGSEFVEGLLEDALLFNTGEFRWETKKNGVGIWVTQPREHMGKEMSGETPGLLEDEYDYESNEEEELRGDGGEWDSDADDGCTMAVKLWTESNNLEDPITGEVIVENKPYDSEDDSDSDDAQMAMDVKSEQDVEEPFLSRPPEEDDEAMDYDQSSCDSDFDSDEVLSGDDIALLGSNYQQWYGQPRR